MPVEYLARIDNDEGDNPYGDIIVYRCVGNSKQTIARFPQDDAPVRDWNIAQYQRAVKLACMLTSEEGT